MSASEEISQRGKVCRVGSQGAHLQAWVAQMSKVDVAIADPRRSTTNFVLVLYRSQKAAHGGNDAVMNGANPQFVPSVTAAFHVGSAAVLLDCREPSTPNGIARTILTTVTHGSFAAAIPPHERREPSGILHNERPHGSAMDPGISRPVGAVLVAQVRADEATFWPCPMTQDLQTLIGTVDACEVRLERAMQAADATALERLLGEDFVFTGHQGHVL